jgi:hypothetical protein
MCAILERRYSTTSYRATRTRRIVREKKGKRTEESVYYMLHINISVVNYPVERFDLDSAIFGWSHLQGRAFLKEGPFLDCIVYQLVKPLILDIPDSNVCFVEEIVDKSMENF